MGLLSLFTRPLSRLTPLPNGSFTMDQEGRILVSTLPQTFPVGLAEDIGAQILESFRSAKAARLPLCEVIVRYPSLKITARELRGGAIVFLAPQTLSSTPG